MNSELEAIMRRRRRKADGLPGSPNPYARRAQEGNVSSSNAATNTSFNQQQQQGVSASHRRSLLIGVPPPPPPTPPPPPSSVSTTRRTSTKTNASLRNMAMETVVGQPPPPPPPPPPPLQTSATSSTPRLSPSPRSASTRRRALDQIRSARRAFATTSSGSGSGSGSGSTTLRSPSSDVKQTTTQASSSPSLQDKMASPTPTTPQQHPFDESILTHAAVVHNDSTILINTPTAADDTGILLDTSEDDRHYAYDATHNDSVMAVVADAANTTAATSPIAALHKAGSNRSTSTSSVHYGDNDALDMNPTDESQEFLTPASSAFSSSEQAVATATAATTATALGAVTSPSESLTTESSFLSTSPEKSALLSPVSSSLSSPEKKSYRSSLSSLLVQESSSSFHSTGSTSPDKAAAANQRFFPSKSSSSSFSPPPPSDDHEESSIRSSSNNDAAVPQEEPVLSSTASIASYSSPPRPEKPTPSSTAHRKSIANAFPITTPEAATNSTDTTGIHQQKQSSDANVDSRLSRDGEDDAMDEAESSVDSPARSSPTRSIPTTNEGGGASSSSSDEQAGIDPTTLAAPPPPPPASKLFDAAALDQRVSSSSFANFEADFASFPATTTSAFGNHTHDDDNQFGTREYSYEPPPSMMMAEYEPPPAFPAFDSSPSAMMLEPVVVDYTPLQNVPSRVKPQVELKRATVIPCASENNDNFPDSPHPVTNPLTGNVITCWRNKDGVVGISEIQVDTCAQVEYTVILTSQVQEKFKTRTSASAHAVSKVRSIAAGVHRSEGQQARVRVAAVVEFHTLHAGKKSMKTVLLVWQWGYGSSRPVALQSLLSPPNKASFTYEADSLKMSDGVVFLSGTVKGKGPCVFCVKPYVKDVWSANLVPGTGTISSMAVSGHRKHKYVALAQTDGSLSVWTYQSALDRKGAETPKALFPLCRLDGATAIANSTETVGDADGYISEEGTSYCTGLAWIGTEMLLLAAAYTKGMVIFHVSLPLLVEKDNSGTSRPIANPTASTQLSQTVLLSPFVATRWTRPMERASVSWVDLGPCPCLCFLLSKDSTFEAIMGAVCIPQYGDAEKDSSAMTCRFQMLCSSILSTRKGNSSIFEFVGPYSVGSSLIQNSGSVETLTPKLSTDDSFFRSFMCPATSAVPGLDSAGFVSVPDGNDDDGFLQIFTVKQCQRELTDLPSPVPTAHRMDWSSPTQRHLLCRSFAGDTKEAQDPSPAVQAASEYGDIESITAGTYTNLICDIKVDDGLIPRRVVRCNGASLCALLLYRALDHKDGPSIDAVSIALVDTDKGEIVDYREGRDIIFMSSATPGIEQALILGVDGSSIRTLRRVPPTDDSEDAAWEVSDPARPLLGFEADQDYVEGRRLVLLSSAERSALLVVGTRERDERSCLVRGGFVDMGQGESGAWKRLVPSVKKNSILWLNAKETIQSLLDLPSYQNSSNLLAVVSNSRIMLLSYELRVAAEIGARLLSTSLAPLGSHAVAYCSEDCKLRYLCSLRGKFSSGLLATFPSPRVERKSYQLVAVRPDRFIYTNSGSCVRLVERGENADLLSVPTAMTRPALLLEPMVANAICESDTPGESTAILRAVIERFGRKVTPFPHGDDEGIGSVGSGITPAVLEMLSVHGLKHAASWLLTGSCGFDRGANSRILPPWIPICAKTTAALNRDASLHIIANGDQYFSEYVKSPDHNMASTLPRQSDPSALVCHGLAQKAMEDGDVAGALKLLDIAGAASSDSTLLQLALSLQLDEAGDISQVLQTLSGQKEDGYGRSMPQQSTTSSLAALVLDLKSRQVDGKVPQQGGECGKASDDTRRRYVAQLAPSIQRSRRAHRARHRLIGEAALGVATNRSGQAMDYDNRFQNPCNESKHVWNEGPQNEKESLLLLDRMEEWLGRKRPAVLGKEGAEAALERGEKTLADILNKANDYDDDSFGGESGGDDGALLKEGWVEGVGKGRTDEDNLSLYLRMSEGADEDSTWRTDGLIDLTPYANKALLLGQRDCFALTPTSSSVDEGEPGKVKLLYDLVFEAPRDGEGPCGLAVEAPRGSSVDVGILHSDAHDERRRCSLEFWFHLPVAESVSDEIVLVRRSVCLPNDDMTKLCNAASKDDFLWDLVVLPSGEIEFRSNGGTTLLSTSESSSEFEQNQAMGDFGDDTEHSTDEGGRVSWERPGGGGGWNHICLVISSRQKKTQTECSVKIFMRGVKVASTIATIVPPGLEGDGLEDSKLVDDALKKTAYLFGLNAVPDYRMTEVRLWSCERNEDDVKMMMYEYLRAAETKKKFKVRIRNKREEGTAATKSSGTGGLLSPPPSAGGLLSPPREWGTKTLLPRPRNSSDMEATSVPPVDGKNFGFDVSFGPFGVEKDAITEKEELLEAELKAAEERDSLRNAAVPSREDASAPELAAMESAWAKMQNESFAQQTDNTDSQVTGAVLETKPSLSRLSQQVRSSAAAAVVRGPPATRHFGGNRGGLARATPGDRNDSKRFGVGSIAICGAEKTVVYNHDQDPKGKTYPIGASGAVISDEMDNGEYLCCFLAKDKRMVVFELLTRTVVVELQMTTKLNFWRYLPPQAHGHTLVFMLITPVGGFHWAPLDESPRPIQVWKRGPALQGKKIVTYEEGGSNGFSGAEALSAVALLLVSTASTGTPLEAWILQVGGESKALCVSSNVLGAALFRPVHIEDEAFLPHLVTATRVESEIVVKVEPLSQDPSTSNLGVEDVSIGAIIDQTHVRREAYSPPALAMGGWPEVIFCSGHGFVVACVRRKGLVVAYDCQEELMLVRQVHVENYIVDGALRPATVAGVSDDAEATDVELILLLSDADNPRDGFVMSVDITRK